MSELAREALSRTNFSIYDWGIVVAYLSVSLVIGLFVKRFAVSMTSYIGAGRGVGTWLGVATMTGTELGLITVMYSAEKGFNGGFAAFHIAALAGIVTLMVGLTGFVVVPLRKLKVLTIPEYYEQRFDRSTRILGGTILAFGGILNMGLFLKIGSMFIVGITGLPADGFALFAVMTILLVLVLVYTVLGGMVSVIITDYIQFVVLSFGLLLTTCLAISKLGWTNIFDTVGNRMGESGFNPLADGEFGPSYVVWMAITGLISCAVWPTAVARALSMKSTEALKRQYMWSSISFTIRFMIPYFWGICALVFFVTMAPELEGLFVASSEGGEAELSPLYAMPIFLGRLLPAGVIGVVSAAMIAAFMSTHDSYLLCWSSVITQDVVAPLKSEQMTANQRIRLTRIMIVVIGIFIWAWGLFYDGGDDVWDYMAITGAIYFTGAIPLLIGGLYWKRASTVGAKLSLLAGCSAVLGLEPLRVAVQNALQLPELTSAHVGLLTVGLTSTVFVIGSLAFPSEKQHDKTTTTEK
ncbi:MAG TPA: sodium:solute symporter family protein [Planctomycetes bacterium]|nr:sodium:solute symporter family protein [Planctomycetaceae bacterium]HIM30787.1 sodium:solute symporter family protein [Planctomycetota bacterium]